MKFFFEVIYTSSCAQFLPAGWGPYAYFRTLGESGAQQTQAAANTVNKQDVEAQVENQPPDERNSNTVMGLSLAQNPS